jgi:hypothetical protein
VSKHVSDWRAFDVRNDAITVFQEKFIRDESHVADLHSGTQHHAHAEHIAAPAGEFQIVGVVAPVDPM